MPARAAFGDARLQHPRRKRRSWRRTTVLVRRSAARGSGDLSDEDHGVRPDRAAAHRPQCPARRRRARRHPPAWRGAELGPYEPYVRAGAARCGDMRTTTTSGRIARQHVVASARAGALAVALGEAHAEPCCCRARSGVSGAATGCAAAGEAAAAYHRPRGDDALHEVAPRATRRRRCTACVSQRLRMF